MKPPMPLPDREGAGLLIWAVMLAVASWIAATRSIQQVGSPSPWVRVVGNFMSSMAASILGGALAWEYVGPDKPHLIVVAIGISGWAGAAFLDRLFEWVARKWMNGAGPTF